MSLIAYIDPYLLCISQVFDRMSVLFHIFLWESDDFLVYDPPQSIHHINLLKETILLGSDGTIDRTVLSLILLR